MRYTFQVVDECVSLILIDVIVFTPYRRLLNLDPAYVSLRRRKLIYAYIYCTP